ncbi:hypothetical protein CORC01_12007 [Colletotrichum orchidophilum]|uniref:Uncharacterized protein n=1 Tax=Colletotrichum orchidophilum TaxID=1209926 RepID=A0A1G4AUB1_9PEZI|nr:uncharacterized protein CORC01_12007 [Colletotrichum orchidophilum]OHE92673.1 hypothetical protein CORC01_12007 [Colletotrichum orchidophilum]
MPFKDADVAAASKRTLISWMSLSLQALQASTDVKFFASAYHNTPVEMKRPDPTQLFDNYRSQLQQLRKGNLSAFTQHLTKSSPNSWTSLPRTGRSCPTTPTSSRIMSTSEIILGPDSTTIWEGASDAQKRRMEAARLIGLFLANGFQHGMPSTEESEDLRFLGAVIFKH